MKNEQAMQNLAIQVCIELAPWIGSQYLTGSRVICRPFHPDADLDIILLTRGPRDFYNHVGPFLDAASWHNDGSDPRVAGPETPPWMHSYTKDGVNLIITGDPDRFKRFCAATEVAQRMNLRDKTERIILFHAVVFGQTPQETLEELTRRRVPLIDPNQDPDNLPF